MKSVLLYVRGDFMDKLEKIIIINKDAFYAIGLRCEVTFEEANKGEIRILQQQFLDRLDEIENRKNNGVFLGLSFNAIPSGNSNSFIHYVAAEINSNENISVPDHMHLLSIPALAYVTYQHRKKDNIKHSYDMLYRWINHNGFQFNKELTHIEEYPITQDPFDPNQEFLIMIPIIK